MNDSRTTTILMADDDPSHLMLAEAALAGAGFVVHTVDDGADAVEQFESVNPDVVILDVNMPRMSGIDACRAIRGQAGGRIFPILMLTGRNDLPVISDAFSAGASDFAQKGLNPRLLVERVRFLLRDRAMQQELVSGRSKLLLAQRIARVGHWELNVEGRTQQVSPVIGEILELDPATLGRFEDFVKRLEPAEQLAVRQAFIACATGAGRFSFDHKLHTAAGNAIWVHQEAELVDATGGNEATVMVTLQDLTRLHRAEETVRHLSYFDTATGLPNRRQLSEQVAAVLKDRAGAVATAVVAFRMHGYDRIVQAQGLEAANRLVARLAKRIEDELANVSQGGAVPWKVASAAVCRTSDSTLAMVLRSRVSAEHLAGTARSILESVSARAPGGGDEYLPVLSGGVAFAEGDQGGAEQLMQHAQAAAEQAVEPRGCEVYSPVPLARTRRRLQIESALRGAVERGEISLGYRPRVSVDTYELTGVECVSTWTNEQVGAVSPEEFAEVAESAGVVDDIGRFVLGEACRHVAAWRKQFDRDFFVSVKVAGRQLRDPQFVANVDDLMRRYGLPGRALEVAVTESSIVAAPREARSVLEGLRDLGVRIAIDDFGAGYASFSQIRRLPFDSMKLERSLVADLYTDVGAQGVIAAVLAMARGLNVRAVADGIEDSATLQMLGALGCDEIQGPYIAAPMNAKFFATWLEDGGAAYLAQKHAREIINALESVELRSQG